MLSPPNDLIILANMPAHDRNAGRLHPSDAGASTSHRSRSPNLHLAGLPRFHPANFPSVNPSSAGSPLVTSPTPPLSSPATPSSPRQQYQHLYASAQYQGRQHLDAPQRQLHAHQRDLINMNRLHASQTGQLSPTLSSTTLRAISPLSPRLDPCGSPGPVTPLELEARDGYMFPGSGSNKQLSEDAKDQVMESYMRKEGGQVRPMSPVAEPRAGPRSPRFVSVSKGDLTRHRSHLSR